MTLSAVAAHLRKNAPIFSVGTVPLDRQIQRRVVVILEICVLFTVWTICNPFYEVDRSSLIYAARALADLDPQGVGRDIMFSLDGQSDYTVFTPVYRAMVAAFGASSATLAISISSIVTSFIGVYALASTICVGRTRSLAIVFAAALPACYGGFKIFSFSETAATPRPFAEALILCAIAAILRDRRWLAGVLALAATMLHPIMALPGLVVLIAWLISTDRRWLIPLCAAIGVALVGAVLHADVHARLTTLVDPAWKAVLMARNPHLFPSLWPEGWIGRGAARIATLLIGASLVVPRVRMLFLIVIVVGLIGLCAAYYIPERLPIILIVQVQTWRSLWLVFALATIAAAICTIELWQRGGAGHVVVALLALTWVYADCDRAAILLAATALAFHFALRANQGVLPPRSVKILVGISTFVFFARLIQIEADIAGAIGDAHDGGVGEVLRTLAIDWDYTPLAALTGSIAILWRYPIRPSALAGLLGLGAVLVGGTWDRRSAETRFFDGAIDVPDLKRLVATRDGEVFWIGGVRESWWWLDRPQWLSPIQGAGLVFSRPLALLYRDRSQRAVEAGLDGGGILQPFSDHHSPKPLRLDPSKIIPFCSAPDAPSWIIAPSEKNDDVPAQLRAVRWEAPVAKVSPKWETNGSLSWRQNSKYSIIPCAHP